jgi:hypothetical protein
MWNIDTLFYFILTKYPTHDGVWGSGCRDPRFLDLSKLHAPAALTPVKEFLVIFE